MELFQQTVTVFYNIMIGLFMGLELGFETPCTGNQNNHDDVQIKKFEMWREISEFPLKMDDVAVLELQYLVSIVKAAQKYKLEGSDGVWAEYMKVARKNQLSMSHRD